MSRQCATFRPSPGLYRRRAGSTARHHSGSFHRRPGHGGCLGVAPDREVVRVVSSDVLLPIHDSAERSAVVAADGDLLARSCKRRFVAMDHALEIGQPLRDDLARGGEGVARPRTTAELPSLRKRGSRDGRARAAELAHDKDVRVGRSLFQRLQRGSDGALELRNVRFVRPVAADVVVQDLDQEQVWTGAQLRHRNRRLLVEPADVGAPLCQVEVVSFELRVRRQQPQVQALDRGIGSGRPGVLARFLVARLLRVGTLARRSGVAEYRDRIRITTIRSIRRGGEEQDTSDHQRGHDEHSTLLHSVDHALLLLLLLGRRAVRRRLSMPG